MRFGGGPHVCLQQSMESLGAFGQFGQVSVFQGLGERIEQAPDIAAFERVVSWITPFVQHGGVFAPAFPSAPIRGASTSLILNIPERA